MSASLSQHVLSECTRLSIPAHLDPNECDDVPLEPKLVENTLTLSSTAESKKYEAELVFDFTQASEVSRGDYTLTHKSTAHQQKGSVVILEAEEENQFTVCPSGYADSRRWILC